MRAASLFATLALAHLLVLVGRSAPLSPWAPVAYLWQDLLVALLFGAIDILFRRSRLVWPLYGAIVLYAAINVPVTRILSSPLTLPMMRAARGPLADSISHYLTLESVGAILLVVAGGIAFPIGL